MESFENHKLPVLRDRDATDPARIVRWAKEALTCGQAHPKVLEKYNLLRFCVSEEVREMWAALTDDVEGAPADDYPEDINIDSTDTEELAKKRDWHVEWLQAVISYYSTSHIAKVGFGTKPASWILVWLRAHGSFPGFVLETPRRGRQKRKARSLGFCILYKSIGWPGFVLSPTFWRKQSTMSGFVGKRGV